MEYVAIWVVSIVILSTLYYKYEIKPECEKTSTYILTSEDLFLIIIGLTFAPLVLIVLMLVYFGEHEFPIKTLYTFKCKDKKKEEEDG